MNGVEGWGRKRGKRRKRTQDLVNNKETVKVKNSKKLATLSKVTCICTCMCEMEDNEILALCTLRTN